MTQQYRVYNPSVFVPLTPEEQALLGQSEMTMGQLSEILRGEGASESPPLQALIDQIKNPMSQVAAHNSLGRIFEQRASDAVHQMKTAPKKAFSKDLFAGVRVMASCKRLWDFVDEDVKKTIKENSLSKDAFYNEGKNILKTNWRITEAYNRLFKDAPNLRWAGLAAIVSRQANCAMQHAIKQGKDTNLSVGNILYASHPVGWLKLTKDQLEASAAPIALMGLGEANREIFRDMYPPMRFYASYGIDKLIECGLGRVPEELLKAIRIADSAKDPREGHTPESSRVALRKAADMMGDYEQRYTIQRVYNDFFYKKVFGFNETLANSPIGSSVFEAMKAEVGIAATCTSQTVPFPEGGSINNGNDRVEYYMELMTAYDRLSEQEQNNLHDALTNQIDQLEFDD